MLKTEANTGTYLKKLKDALDEVFPHKPCLHVCIEAAHPDTLGRPSDLLLNLMLGVRFDNQFSRDGTDIQVHLIPDRLSVPQLEGHILTIGGPRSNVISRIAMEYETEFQTEAPFYRRYTGVTFDLDYTHVYRRTYGGRLLADMSSMDRTAQDLIAAYYRLLGSREFREKSTNLFSVNRYLHHPEATRLPSLSAMLENGTISDHVIYDQLVETIMPNVFSDHWDRNVLIICHGLRDLATFAGALQYDDQEHVADLKSRLKDFKSLHSSTRSPGALQRGWSVIRPLEATLDIDPIREVEHLLDTKGFNPISNELGTNIFISPHDVEPNQRVVAKDRVERFRDDIRVRHHYGQDKSHTQSNDTDTSGDQLAGLSKVSQAYANSRRKFQALQLEEINEQQILDAMSVPRDEFFRRHEIYALGCFEQKKTVYTQQSRALTLIHALFKAGKISRETKVAIVGGGVSGMTAAIAAAEIGARVVLCEQASELSPIQRDCEHRWLHPFFYDWPNENCDLDVTDLPLRHLNWSAGRASDVFQHLAAQFKEYGDLRNSNDNKEFTIYNNFPVRMILRDKKNGKHIISQRALVRRKDTEAFQKKSAQEKRKLNSNELVLARQASTPANLLEDDEERALWERDWKMAASQLVRQIQSGETENGTPLRRYNSKGTLLQEYDNERKLHRDEIVDCDILIFATGYGTEDPQGWLKSKKIEMPDNILLNNSYWASDIIPPSRTTSLETISRPETVQTGAEPQPSSKPLYIVSGAGDGALIDILRLCIKQFIDPDWHSDFVKRMSRAIQPDQTGAIWSNRRDVLVFAEELSRLMKSDRFRLIEGEKDRLAQIDRTMKGFDIDAFLDQFDIELNYVEVYNVSKAVQPFWADAAVAHQLLIWCLYKKGSLRFLRGEIESFDPSTGILGIRRTITGKTRTVRPEGVVIRHGVGQQPGHFLNIQGMFIDVEKSPQNTADDAKRLVALLKLSNRLHPETEKFFRHTVKHLR